MITLFIQFCHKISQTQTRTWCKPKVMMKWNETLPKTWQFAEPITLALLGASQETLLKHKLTTLFHQCSERSVCSHRRVIVDRRLSNSNLRKRLQGLGSASSFYAYILLFHFCLLINCSLLLIIPLPGALHKALRAEKAILAAPKQLRRRQSTETGHASLKECNISFKC